MELELFHGLMTRRVIFLPLILSPPCILPRFTIGFVLFYSLSQNLKITHTKSLIKSITKYETPALAGIVIIQAQTILLPIPHLTAETRLTAPAPMIAPEIA